MNADIVLILNGRKNDRGFVQEGYDGAIAACAALGLTLAVIEHASKDPAELQAHTRNAAAGGARGVIVHGSRADAALDAVAPDFPQTPFLSPGGYAMGPNIWNYAVRHYQAAFLAGVAAARLTVTGVVGHLSGVPIAPGKRGRAAYVGGVRHADPSVRIVTGFCGEQDDPALARRWVEAEIAEGVDILFTMLNFGRSGAIEACRAHGIRQIGNIRDWAREEPDVFVASAIAGHGWSIDAWLKDLVAGRLEQGRNAHAGLEVPRAVRLALAEDFPEPLRQEISAVSGDVVAGRIAVPDSYDGPEFQPKDVVA